jgi:hypothetical protein
VDSNLRQSRKVWECGETRNHAERCNWKSGAEGQPEAPAPAAPKDARRGATRESVAGKAGRCRNRGNPGKCIGRRNWKGETTGKPVVDATEALKDERFEATRRSIAGKAGRCRSRAGPGGCIDRRKRRIEDRGDLRFTTGCAEGRETRGNSRVRRRQSLRMQGAGQLAASSGGATGRAKPRGFSTRRAEGCENRGNSKLHRGHSL